MASCSQPRRGLSPTDSPGCSASCPPGSVMHQLPKAVRPEGSAGTEVLHALHGGMGRRRFQRSAPCSSPSLPYRMPLCHVFQRPYLPSPKLPWQLTCGPGEVFSHSKNANVNSPVLLVGGTACCTTTKMAATIAYGTRVAARYLHMVRKHQFPYSM